MVPHNGDESPASIAFRGDLYLLLGCGDIIRCQHGAWKDCASGELIHADGERLVSKNSVAQTEEPNIPKRSRRAVAVADLAAQGRWLCFRVV